MTENDVAHGSGSKGTILVIEDESIVADLIASMLRNLGYTEIVQAFDIERAMRIIDSTSLEAATLDANLRGRPTHELAARLLQKGIPFVVSTGYDPQRLPTVFAAGVPLRKPFFMEALRSALEAALKGGRGGEHS